MQIEVERCPFCRHRAEAMEWTIQRSGERVEGWINTVGCTNRSCRATGPRRRTARGAVIAWNSWVRGGLR